MGILKKIELYLKENEGYVNELFNKPLPVKLEDTGGGYYSATFSTTNDIVSNDPDDYEGDDVVFAIDIYPVQSTVEICQNLMKTEEYYFEDVKRDFNTLNNIFERHRYYEMEFSRQDYNISNSHGIIPNEDHIKVMSTVIDAFKQFFRKEKNVGLFSFQAKENSRIKLYDRFAKIIQSKLNVKLLEGKDNYLGKVYIFIKPEVEGKLKPWKV